MRINNNIGALNTHRQLNLNSANQAKNMERLSSGLRINRGADDAAGLSISEKMRAQIKGLDRASQNAQDGISLIQTADGALNETHSILQRMRELGVQASNETNVAEDWNAIQKEIDALVDEIDNIANNTKFNGQTLLNGDLAASGVSITIGSSTEALDLTISDMNAAVLGGTDNLTTFKTGQTNAINTSTAGANRTNAQSLITAVDNAIKSVSAERSQLGANQNRLEFTINNLKSTSQNLTAAESRIRDVDMAKEVMENSKNSILSQAAQAMLAQANQQPQAVLQLLRG